MPVPYLSFRTPDQILRTQDFEKRRRDMFKWMEPLAMQGMSDFSGMQTPDRMLQNPSPLAPQTLGGIPQTNRLSPGPATGGWRPFETPPEWENPRMRPAPSRRSRASEQEQGLLSGGMPLPPWLERAGETMEGAVGQGQEAVGMAKEASQLLKLVGAYRRIEAKFDARLKKREIGVREFFNMPGTERALVLWPDIPRKEALAKAEAAGIPTQATQPTIGPADPNAPRPLPAGPRETYGVKRDENTEYGFPGRGTVFPEEVGSPIEALKAIDEPGREIGALAAGALRLSAETTGLPVAGPLGGAGASTETLQLINDRGLGPGLSQAGEEIPFAKDVLNPINFVALPIIDAQLAALLGAGFSRLPVMYRAGRRVLPMTRAKQLAQDLTKVSGNAEHPAEVRRAAMDALDSMNKESAAALPVPARPAAEAAQPAVREGVPSAGVQEPTGLGAARFAETPQATAEGQGMFPFEARQGEVGRITKEMEEAYEANRTIVGETPLEQAQRDDVADALLRKVHPRVDKVGRRLPPGERVALAEEVTRPQYHGVEDFDTFEQRWQGRYRNNLMTWVDDRLAPLRGVDREGQRAVRDHVIMRNLYVSVEQSRARMATLRWAGTAKAVLDLQTFGHKTGYALAIKPKPGAMKGVHPDLVQRVDDIAQFPDDYIITPEQRAALDEQTQIFEFQNQAEQRQGIDVMPVKETYRPWVVTKIAKGDPAGLRGTMRQRYPNTHPFFTRERKFKDIRQLYAAGYKTADPLSAMATRLELGVGAIGDQQMIRRIQKLGVKPSEKIDKVVVDELRAARQGYSQARAKATQTGSVADRDAAVRAQTKLAEAKRVRDLAAKRVKEQRPVVFGRSVTPAAGQELSRFMEDLGPFVDVTDDLFQLMRTSMITADHGSLLIQNWTTFWRDNPRWLQAAGLSLRHAADAPWDWIVRNPEAIDNALTYGFAVAPEEFILMRGGSLSRAVGQLPVIKQSQNMFEMNIFLAQVERSKPHFRVAKTQDELLDLAATVRRSTGSALMPGLTKRQAWLQGKLWFAPSFTAALHSFLMDPLVLKGAARREAIRTVGQAFGGAAAATIALNQFINGEMPNMTDPDKPGFWGVWDGNSYAYPFGPFQPIIEAMARTARGDPKALPKLVTDKTSVPGRWALRIAEVMGLPVEEIRGPSYERPEAKYEGESAWSAAKRGLMEEMPIGPMQAIEGIREGGGWLPGLETIGGRVRVETPAQELRRRFQDKFKREYDPSRRDAALAETDSELGPIYQRAHERALEKGSKYALEKGELGQFLQQEEQEMGVGDAARAYLADPKTEGPGFVERYRAFSKLAAIAAARDYFGKDFETSDDPMAKTYREMNELNPYAPEFEDEETGKVDWDMFFSVYDAEFAKLPKALQKAIETRTKLSDPDAIEVEKDYKVARGLVGDLHEIVPIVNLSLENYEDMLVFRHDARKNGLEAIDKYGDEGNWEWHALLIKTGEMQGKSDNFVVWAWDIGKTNYKQEFMNPKYVDFLADHEDEIRPFYPEIYERKWLLEELHRRRGAR